MAEKLVADRLAELQERRCNKTLVGVERQESGGDGRRELVEMGEVIEPD